MLTMSLMMYCTENRSLANWLWNADTSSDEMQPMQKLRQLHITRLTRVDDDNVNTVDVSDKLIIDDVVRLIARELPDTQVSDTYHRSNITITALKQFQYT